MNTEKRFVRGSGNSSNGLKVFESNSSNIVSPIYKSYPLESKLDGGNKWVDY